MKCRPKISDSEWHVMKVLWTESPVSANRIVDKLGKESSWKPKTIRTLINRLVGKKAVGFDRDGRQYMYYPLLSEEECIQQETRSFLRRIRSGAFKPMLAAFLEEENLSREEIEGLKKILESKEGR